MTSEPTMPEPGEEELAEQGRRVFRDSGSNLRQIRHDLRRGWLSTAEGALNDLIEDDRTVHWCETHDRPYDENRCRSFEGSCRITIREVGGVVGGEA